RASPPPGRAAMPTIRSPRMSGTSYGASWKNTALCALRVREDRSKPPRLSRRLVNHHAAQIRRRLRESLLQAHGSVLVLDRQDMIVALRAQHADKALPELVAVAVAARAKDPGTMRQVAVTLGVQRPVDAQVVLVQRHVLRVDV